MKLTKINLFICLIFLLGCDFSSRLQKEILFAQESINDHNYKKAVEHYSEAIKLNPPEEAKVKILYQLGELSTVHLHQHHQAINYFKQIIDSSTNPLWQVKAQERISEIYFTILKNYEKAVANYKSLVNYLPELDDKEFYELRVAISYKFMGNYKTAQKLFESITKNQEHKFFIDSWYHLGLTYMLQKKWTKAEDTLRRYLRLERRRDKIVQGRFVLANILETTENLKAAYEMYYSILGEYPNTEVVKNRLDSLYQRRIARKR